MNRLTRRIEWASLAMTLLLLGAVTAYVRYKDHNETEALEEARLQGQARTVTENLHQQLLAVNSALAGARSDFPQLVDEAAARAASHRLKVLSDVMPGVRTLTMVDAQGHVSASSRDEFLGRDVSHRDYFKVPRAQPDSTTLYVSPPFTTLLGVYAINVGRAVLGPAGEFAGVVTATLDPEYFNVAAASVLYAPDMSTSVVHGDGFVILNVPFIAGGAPTTSLRKPGYFFSRHMDSGQIATVFSGTVRSTGAQRMMAQHTLQSTELRMDKPLVIAMARDLSGIYQPWLRQTQLYALLFALLALASCLALFVLQRQRTAVQARAARLEFALRLRQRRRTDRLASRLQASTAGLRHSEQTLSLAADAAHLGVWTLDLVRDGVWASEHWSSLFGFEPEEQINIEALLERVHTEDRPAVRAALVDVLQGADGFDIEFRIELPDGQQRWVATRGRAEFDAGGQPALMRGVSLDITPRKEAEQELQRQRREVTHLSRVTMLGELSGAMAHELNQPLTAILSNAQAAQRFLSKEKFDRIELREILQDIVSEDKRAGEVIRRLRLLLSTGQTQRQEVDVNETVSEVVKLLRSDLVSQGVKTDLELAPNLPPVFADRVELQQVLINLVMNACDAMVATAAADRRLLVRSSLADGASVCVSVIDRGCGIAADRLEKVFESYFTTKAQGMGLGLSICRTIVNAHGGRLWAENNAERGASLHFTVPLYGGAAG